MTSSAEIRARLGHPVLDADGHTVAFDTRLNGFDARLRAIFSSDVGHWDVPDITEVLEEAYELLDAGLIDARDFRDFTFANAVRLYTDVNPSFFDGTVLAEAARAELAA